MAFDFAELAKAVIDVVNDEASFPEILDLPVSPGHQHYIYAIVGVWSRQDRWTKVRDCGGRCHLVRP
ncbi:MULTISPECIES: hypothetical protein [Sorangium]|uniref:hypothetical protein n=1 Tax=Sorangium TaxID=39643 RepID=UPI003D9C583E